MTDAPEARIDEATAAVAEWLDSPAADDRFTTKREVMLDAAACDPALLETWLQMAWKRGHAAGHAEMSDA